MTQNVEKRFLFQGLLVNIYDNLPKEFFSDAAYHIAKRQISATIHPLLPLELQEVLRQELNGPKSLDTMKRKQLILVRAQQFLEINDSPSRCSSVES